MRELPKISDAEWQVMKVLWKESPLNASQVINELQNYTTWSPKTIHTLLGRLADKGARMLIRVPRHMHTTHGYLKKNA